MTRKDTAAQMEGDLGFRSFAERCEPPEHPAAWRLAHACPVCNGCVNLETMTCDKCAEKLRDLSPMGGGPNPWKDKA